MNTTITPQGNNYRTFLRFSRPWIFFSLVLNLLWGCSGEDSSNNQTGGASGAGGQAGAGATAAQGGMGNSGSGGSAATSGSTSEDDCSALCRITSTCTPSYDPNGPPFELDPCIAQCKIEMQGNGVLAKEIALRLVQDIRLYDPDPNCYGHCAYGYGFSLWEGAMPYVVEETDKLTHCTNIWAPCEGWQIPEDMSQKCFMEYYRYNEDRRAQFEECFSLVTPDTTIGCSALDECVKPLVQEALDNNYLQPWMGKQPLFEYLLEQSKIPFLPGNFRLMAPIIRRGQYQGSKNRDFHHRYQWFHSQ